MYTNISGQIREEVLAKIRNHPARGNRTQADFYEYVFETFLDLPESRIASLEQDLRSLRFQVDFLKERVEKAETPDRSLEAQAEQLASREPEDEPHDSQPALPGVEAARSSAQELEGDFVVVLEKGDSFETASKSFVDLTLRIVGGKQDGHSFVDRLMDFPWAPRTDFCRRAFGLQAGDSLGKSLAEITGRKVMVRRARRQGPDGSPRMITYYHPLRSAASR